MKKLKIVIILISISIIVLVAILIMIKKSDPLKTPIVNNEIQEVEDPLGDENLKEQITNAEYYYVKNSVNQYLQLINKNSTVYFGKDENNDYVKIVTDKEIQEKIYRVLSENYIQDAGITENNVFEHVENIDKRMTFVPVSIQYVSDNGDVKTFITNGIIVNDKKEFVREANFIVNIDNKNETFSIQPVGDNNSEQQIYINKSINQNENNKIDIPSIKIETIAEEYFNIYKQVVINAPKIIYNKLDQEYAKKRFGNEDNFERYVEKNRDELKNIIFKKYLVNNYKDYTEYVCQDQYERLYIFKIKEGNILDYTLELDDYTILNENLDEEYMNLSTQLKVANNINKWIKMLNNRDYQAAFDVLDETFRTDNFQNSVENFENYMREQFPKHYKIEFGEYSDETGISIQEVTLIDIAGEDKIDIGENIYMQLNEGTEFVMSFNLPRY